MTKLATRGELNSLSPGSFTDELNKLATYSEITNKMGLTISRTNPVTGNDYLGDECVLYDDVSGLTVQGNPGGIVLQSGESIQLSPIITSINNGVPFSTGVTDSCTYSAETQSAVMFDETTKGLLNNVNIDIEDKVSDVRVDIGTAAGPLAVIFPVTAMGKPIEYRNLRIGNPGMVTELDFSEAANFTLMVDRYVDGLKRDEIVVSGDIASQATVDDDSNYTNCAFNGVVGIISLTNVNTSSSQEATTITANFNGLTATLGPITLKEQQTP